MHLIEDDKLIGIGAMEVFNNYCVIRDIYIYSSDIGLKELLLKSMLNFLYLHDIENVYSNNENLQDFLSNMQFCTAGSGDAPKVISNENTIYLNLEKYFKCCCN